MSDPQAISRRRFLSQARWIALGAATPGLGWLAGCARPGALTGTRLHTLGTVVTLLVRSRDVRQAERAMHRALREVVAVHADFTLFEPSPLGRLNVEARACHVGVPAWLRAILGQAIDVNRRSQGLFDPALGGRPQGSAATADAVAAGGMADVELDAVAGTLRLHGAHTALDLNGICKGAAVDRAAAVLRAHGLHDFVINAGGDLLAAGNGDDDAAGWHVRLQRGRGLATLTLTLHDRAAATSGNVERGRAGRTRHLRDPRSGQTVDPLRTATALSSSAALADAWATALFVAGPTRAPGLCLATQDLSAVLVHHDGRAVWLGAA